MNFLPFLIAKRLCLKKNKTNTISLISFLSKIGISISVFTLIISFSSLNGFEKLLNKTIISHLPHGIVKFTNQSSLKWRDIIKKLKLSKDILYSEPFFITNGLLVKNNNIKFITVKSFKSIKFFKKKFNIQNYKFNLKKKITVMEL